MGTRASHRWGYGCASLASRSPPGVSSACAERIETPGRPGSSADPACGSLCDGALQPVPTGRSQCRADCCRTSVARRPSHGIGPCGKAFARCSPPYCSTDPAKVVHGTTSINCENKGWPVDMTISRRKPGRPSTHAVQVNTIHFCPEIGRSPGVQRRNGSVSRIPVDRI